MSSKGEIQVDGEIQGDVQCGSLLLGDKSQINGSVLAEDVVVRGRVLGSIRGLRVTLQAQSHVEGDIYHQSLAIEQGAYFEGKSRRTDDPLADRRGATSAPLQARRGATQASWDARRRIAGVRWAYAGCSSAWMRSASAASMNRSISPSSTADGLVLSTPVRRSFTS